jgi:hypothetical protein
LMLSILPALSACAHGSTPPPAVNSYCAIAKPIYYDTRADSANTVKQIEGHNSVWVCLCEQDCPKSDAAS